MATRDEIAKRRDVKVKPHLEQYAPVWLTDEKFFAEDESLQFQIIFQHNLYGWVTRRYRYDGFNNVLYHKGQTVIQEDDVLDIIDHEPYITAVVANIPNAFGG